MVARLERTFPGLKGTSYRVTSPPDPVYNCIAWTGGSTSDWWWPVGPTERSFWPEGAPRAESLDAFRSAFASLGYIPCDHADKEPGWEKIALFADEEHLPTHAARQIASGLWTSKLGQAEHIEHELGALEGEVYGRVALLMKRRQESTPGGAAGPPGSGTASRPDQG